MDTYDRIEQLIMQINGEGSGKYDFILGVARGGLIPAVYISNKLNIPLMVTSYSSNRGNGDGGDNDFEWLENKKNKIKPDSNIIIVDDICDTGYTIEEIYNIVKTKTTGVVHTATIDYKESAVFKPDFYQRKLSRSDGWITYPWEI